MNAGVNAGLNTAMSQPDESVRSRQPLPLSAAPGSPLAGPAVHVDCQGCTVRPHACGDCVVTYLLGSPPEGVDLAPDEQEALDVLAASGLVPALQYRPTDGGPTGPA